MEEYKKSSDQLTCKLTRILANLPAKPNQNPYRCILGGAMGGLNPLRASSQAVFPPPKEQWYQRIPLVAFGSKPPKGNPFGGCFRSNPPQDGPPNLGIARDLLGSIPGRFVTRVLPICMDFLGRFILSHR